MNCHIALHTDRCIGCRTCEAACVESHARAGMQRQARLTLVTTRTISAVVSCHQCEDAPCMAVCPVGVIRREEGVLSVDEQRCISCKMCAIACPYGAIHPSGTSIAGVAGTAFPTPTHPRSTSPLLAWEIGVSPCAVKCDLCKHIAEEPVCVASCPSGALSMVDDQVREDHLRTRKLASAESHEVIMQDTWERGRPS